MIEALNNKPSTTSTWDDLKKFVVDEYSKLMIKADEQSAQAAGFGMAVNVVETPYMEDYIIATREILAAITQALDRKHADLMAQQRKILGPLMEMMKSVAKPATSNRPASESNNNTNKKPCKKCLHCRLCVH